jgi:uncharacterized protein YggE
MKKILLLALLTLFTFTAFAQNVDLRRKISVSGTAEQEVTPDIINVTISLQEYMNGKTKVTISQLENELETAVKEAGITKEDFRINNLSAYNNMYLRKKNPDFLAGKQYSIKFHDLNKYNQILSLVDSRGILSTNIDSYEYSKILALKRDLKIQALLAAKEKATYLVNSIGAKLGNVIDITEVENYQDSRIMMSNRAVSLKEQAPVSDIDFKKIKLSFQVNTVFEIIP